MPKPDIDSTYQLSQSSLELVCLVRCCEQQKGVKAFVVVVDVPVSDNIEDKFSNAKAMSWEL